MKRYAAVIIFVSLVMTWGLVFAETLPDMGSPSEETNLKCSVDEVKFLAPSWGPLRGNFRGMFYVMALKVNSNSDIDSVYLGPVMYIDRQGFKIGRYDSLEVKGFKKVYDGKTILVAQEVNKSGLILKLRDENGVPVWGDPTVKNTNYSGN